MSVSKGSINRVNNIRKRSSNDDLSEEKTANVIQPRYERISESERPDTSKIKSIENNTSIQFNQKLPYYLL